MEKMIRIKNTIGLIGTINLLEGSVTFDNYYRAEVSGEVAKALLSLPGYHHDDGVFEVPLNGNDGKDEIGGATILDTRRAGSGDPALVLGTVLKDAKRTVLNTTEAVLAVREKIDAETAKFLKGMEAKKAEKAKVVKVPEEVANKKLPKEFAELERNSLNLNDVVDDTEESGGGLENSELAKGAESSKVEVTVIKGKRGRKKKENVVEAAV